MAATATRPRRKPTPEQSAKAAERRDRFKALARTVAAMSEDQRAEIVARCGAVVTCEGRPLSFLNTCLILSQDARASVVGGFWQWKRAGRRVRKGESALSLWIPTAKGDAGASEPASADIEAPADGEKKGGRARFIIGTVFDVSQTEPDDGGQGAEDECGE